MEGYTKFVVIWVWLGVVGGASGLRHPSKGSSNIVPRSAAEDETLDYFKKLGCQGRFEDDTFLKVLKTCDDCYDRDKVPGIHFACNEDCFDRFDYIQCLYKTGRGFEKKQYEADIKALRDKSSLTPILEADRLGNWGDFTKWENCSDGQFVFGFYLRQFYTGLTLNVFGIVLACSRPAPVMLTSHIQVWGGIYGPEFKNVVCPHDTFVVGFQVRRVNKKVGQTKIYGKLGDLKLICEDGSTIEGDGNQSGELMLQKTCPRRMRICAIMGSLNLPREGQIFQHADHAVNHLSMKCCPMTK